MSRKIDNSLLTNSSVGTRQNEKVHSLELNKLQNQLQDADRPTRNGDIHSEIPQSNTKQSQQSMQSHQMTA